MLVSVFEVDMLSYWMATLIRTTTVSTGDGEAIVMDISY